MIQCTLFVEGYDRWKNKKYFALDLFGGQNHKLWVGSICRQKLEQFQAKTCRIRIQMILKKVSIGQNGSQLAYIFVTHGFPTHQKTSHNHKTVDLCFKSMQIFPSMPK